MQLNTVAASELQHFLEQRHLPTSGRKAQLVHRVQAVLASPPRRFG